MSVQQYLERLFTWESLENTDRGVEFELKNRLVEAELHGVAGGSLDGTDVDAAAITLELPDGTLMDATDAAANPETARELLQSYLEAE
jgi:hydroxymethylglutaryl-CoA reductase (NADPH)